MWYRNSYRRHLCDMHIEDWDPGLLSELSPENYVENLKKAKLQNAMLYFQSHVGLCHYPTKVGTMHKAFEGKEDTMKQIVDLCHENGITVTGYYSLIYNSCEYDKHPEWRMVDENGEGRRGGFDTLANGRKAFRRYGFCCPNNQEYREFVKKQIKEMAEYFTVDGMFYDMPFWPHNCCCKSCRERWKKEVGMPFPVKEDWKDENWLMNMRKRREWMGDFTKMVADETKKHHPEVSVEQNFAFAALPGSMPNCAEPVNEACDYAGGDLYGGPYRQSFTCKIYRNITKNQPFEYMFSRCSPGLRKHTVTKSENEMLSSVFITAAHHGATLVIDAIDPKGTLDGRVYERLGEVFEKETPYEKYFQGDMIEDIGLYYTMRSKFNAHGEPYTNHKGCVNTLDTMIYQNVAAGVTGGYADINRYKVLVAPALTNEDSYDNERIIDYVRNGGCLYFSGGDNAGLLKEFFGASVVGRTEETVTYMAPEDDVQPIFDWYNKDYPLHFDATCPILDKVQDGRIMATLTLPATARSESQYVSIHTDPPCKKTDIPVLLYREFGKGKVIWSALPLECEEMYDYRNIFMRLINTKFAPEYTVSSNAPKAVEVVSFQCDDAVLVSSVLLSEDDVVEEINGFEISVKCSEPKDVQLLPKEQSIPFKYENGKVTFKTRNLNIFDMYRIVL